MRLSFESLRSWAAGKLAPKGSIPGETASESAATSEKGARPRPEDQLRYLYQYMQVDYALWATIRDIRAMDKSDGRVKMIHSRVARDVTRGGLMLAGNPSDRVQKEWSVFVRRLGLNNPQKLKSDARGLLMEGNLPLQWVLDDTSTVREGVRMPSETIRPNISQNGRFLDPSKAYSQVDLNKGCDLADFALWQLTLGRLDPDNFDDKGCMGRPFLDANREVWRKLRMTGDDLVIRRRHRAPLRMSHVLEGASEDELNKYKDKVEGNGDQITLDYYLNKKGSVTALQGDVNLDHIADVVYLLDTFFAGSPLPKGLMGYTDGLSRDILEDLKRDYYDEVDQLQDTLASVYQAGFELQLLLRGINPESEGFAVTFAERRTETLSQTTDRALKLQALGFPRSMIWEEIGKNADEVEARRESDAQKYEPFPEEEPFTPRVSVTPGNGRKGESATSVSHG